jgi:predicted DCC family thiol-disulfide oxidoreductase YuxK
MQRLTVLYDAQCSFCRRCRWWLGSHRALLEMEFVPAGSVMSYERFPTLAQTNPPEELIVIDDEGGVYRGADAWIMCLYALEDYRDWSLRLASPALKPFARAAFELVSRNRTMLSKGLAKAPETDLVTLLAPIQPTPCQIPRGRQ